MNENVILGVIAVSLIALAVSIKTRSWSVVNASIVLLFASAVAFAYRFLGGM